MSNSDSESSSEHYFSSTSFEFATVDGAVTEELSVLNVSDNTPDTSSDDGSQDDDIDLVKQFGHITVNVLKANIVDEKVDVIVNSTIKTLDLKEGSASKALLKKGGNSIQKECKAKYKDGLKPGEIAVTGSGNLSCKYIYHLYLPAWKEGKNKDVILNLMKVCMRKAEESGHTSIAFPALGTGNLGYDRDFVARTMLQAVEKYSSGNSSTSLTNIRFVLFPSDWGTIEAFTKICNKRSIEVQSPSHSISAKIGNISVNILEGSLAEQTTDVIMTSCTRGLDLKKGTLSKNVLDVAGSDLQSECRSKYPKGIQHGEIAVLGPAKLKCKKLYCGALPRYDKPENGADPQQILKTVVTKCLEQASSDGLTSISFPTLGSGHLKYPAHIAAKMMFTSIKVFQLANRMTSVCTVNIIVFNKSSSDSTSYEAFTKECKSWNNKPTPRPRPMKLKRNIPPVPIPRLVTRNIPSRGTPEYCLHMYTGDIYPPLYWSEYTSDKTVKKWRVDEKGNLQYKLIDVDQDVFKKVEKLVLRTWEPAKLGHGRDAQGLSELDYTGLKVTKVQRIENLGIYEEYCNKKQNMFHKAAEGQMFTKLEDIPGLKYGGCKVNKYLDKAWKDALHEEVNEGLFFHGTKKEHVQGLLSMGLDPRMSQGESVLGKAIYMAESSTKADQYTDDRESKRLTHGLQMFLVRASLGKICLVNKVYKMRRPPCCVEGCEDDGCNHEDRYDSVVEEERYIFREFVVYDRQQVYPEYVITYDRVN